MQTVPVSVVPSLPGSLRARPRTALVASADGSFRQKLAQVLGDLRWQVREAAGGAQAWAEAENALPEAVIVDTWLPDLDLAEFLKDFRLRFPQVDVVAAGGQSLLESPRGPYRQELLHALRHCQDTDTASWNAAPAMNESRSEDHRSLPTSSWPVAEKPVLAAPDTFVRRNDSASQARLASLHRPQR